jgi:hypothetical protein
MSSSTYLPFFGKFILIRHIMKKIPSKSSTQNLNKLVGEPVKLFVTIPFSINFRSQIENQVSYYILMWASSFFHQILNQFFVKWSYLVVDEPSTFLGGSKSGQDSESSHIWRSFWWVVFLWIYWIEICH